MNILLILCSYATPWESHEHRTTFFIFFFLLGKFISIGGILCRRFALALRRELMPYDIPRGQAKCTGNQNSDAGIL